ncbi:GtrA family protein [Sansalvadorimonas verongulae]|uniref:GtrA family protein n=1 Tax=Sansalvadorimonas verongulae TaxID=2172824 RepID=UPI0012BD1FF7|nr:GtrA family protein [Sansalvadorimonas verongulae]MTI15182.1 phosphatase PAP2 family protein [Sansalvadorimonas verongulae]
MLKISGADLNRPRSIVLMASGLLLPLVALLALTSLNTTVFFQINSWNAMWPVPDVWVVLTNLGDGFFLFPLVMLLFCKKPDKQLAVIFTMLAGAIFINGAKALFGSIRPVGVLGVDAVHVLGPVLKAHSLPSGHTATVFLAAGLALLYLRGWLRSLVVLIATLCALSRSVVGAHWPLDLALGAWVGIMSAVVGDYLVSKTNSGIKARIAFILLGLLCVGLLPLYDNGFRTFTVVVYQQIVLAVLALAGSVYCAVSLYQDELKSRVKQPGTLLNKLFCQGQRFIKFGLVGASGFVVDMGVYTLIGQWLGAPHLVARGGSYWVAASWNWFWNRTFTFSHAPREKKLKQWGKYLSMCLVSFIPNWGSYYLLTTFIPFFTQYKQLALFVGVLAGMLFNFTIASTFVFYRTKVQHGLRN